MRLGFAVKVRGEGGLPSHDARRRQPGRQLRAHADPIDPIAFRRFLAGTAAGLEFDVMLEAKGKDLAPLKLRREFASPSDR